MKVTEKKRKNEEKNFQNDMYFHRNHFALPLSQWMKINKHEVLNVKMIQQHETNF